MKKLLLAALLGPAISAQARTLVSTQVHPDKIQAEAVPWHLSFNSDRVKILDHAWFANLFGGKGCEALLNIESSDGQLDVSATDTDAHKIAFRWQGHPAALINTATVGFFPVHYEGGTPIHPAFLLKLPHWVTLQLEIHRTNGVKTLRLFLLKGPPGGQTMHPILEASGRY